MTRKVNQHTANPLSRLVDEYLKQLKWNRKTLCIAAGVTEEYFSRVMNDKVSPTAALVGRLIDAMALEGEAARQMYIAAAVMNGFKIL